MEKGPLFYVLYPVMFFLALILSLTIVVYIGNLPGKLSVYVAYFSTFVMGAITIPIFAFFLFLLNKFMAQKERKQPVVILSGDTPVPSTPLEGSSHVLRQASAGLIVYFIFIGVIGFWLMAGMPGFEFVFSNWIIFPFGILLGAFWFRYRKLRASNIGVDWKGEIIRLSFFFGAVFSLISPMFLPDRFSDPLLLIGTPLIIIFYVRHENSMKQILRNKTQISDSTS